MKIISVLFTVLLLAGCTADADSKNYPLGHEDARREKHGKLTGEDGLNILGGGSDEDKKSSGLGVNSFLWRATLDTLSFMPITSADPFGGTIITDWYEDPSAKGERFKVNALILDDRLRSDGIKVSVFRQKLDETNNSWRDEATTKDAATKLENAILARARQLRVQQTTGDVTPADLNCECVRCRFDAQTTPHHAAVGW